MASLVATTVTGELTVGSPGKIIFSSSSNIYLQSGTDSIALKASSGTVLWNSTNQVPASGGTFTGDVTISKSVPKLTFVNTAASNKTWNLQIDGTTFDINENGVGDRLTIAAGGNATFTSNVFRVQSASSTDMLVRINSGSSEVDSRLMIGEGDNYGMTLEYDGVANIGYLGMNDNVAPTGAWSKRIQMTRAGTEVAFMAGSVGIGVASPTSLLHIAGTSAYLLDVQQTAVNWTGRFENNGGAYGLSIDTANNIVNDVPNLACYTPGGTVAVSNRGRLGVGLTAPATQIHSHASSGNNSIYVTTDGTSSAKTSLWFAHNYTSSGDYAGIIWGDDNILRINNSGSSTDQHIAINEDGNVGIGTDNPGRKLTVYQGKIGVTDGYCVGSMDGSTGMLVNQNNHVEFQINGAQWFKIASTGITTANHSNAHITCGKSATNGGPFLRKHYSDPHYLNVLSSYYSSGATCIGYGAAGKAGGSGYVATYGNFSGNKSILELGPQSLTFKCTASAAQVTVGDDITLVDKFVVTNSDVSTTVNFKIPQGNLFYLDGGSNTYIYSDTSDSIALATNSGVRMTLNNSGVGINVAPDGGLKIKSTGDGVNVLNMVDSAGDAMFNVRQSSNDCLIRAYKDGGSQKVQIHTDGDSYLIGGALGIGTSGPETRLHVEGTNYTDSSIKMERSGSGQDEDAGLIFSKSSAATDGHRLGGVYFGHSGTNYALIRGQMEASTGGEVYIVAADQTNPISNSAVKTLQITAAVTTINGAFRPRLDSTYTLGQTSLRWSTVYADEGAFGTENKSPVQALGRDAYMLVLQRTTGDTDGGTLTENTWVTRELNSTQTNTISSASLSSYMISLPSGTYYARFWAGGYRVQEHQAQLYNNTDSSVIFHGTNQDAPSGGTTFSTGEGVFTLSGTKSILLRHIVDATYSTDAGGRSLGQDNITNYSYNTYAGVEIWKTS